MFDLDTQISELKNALLSVDRFSAKQILTEWRTDSATLQGLEDIIVHTLEEIGLDWEEGRAALSQVYMSGRICEELITEFNLNFTSQNTKQPKMAIAVLEDFHGLGKRIVQSIILSNGYKMIDYGLGISVEKLVRQTLDDKIEILLISVLMLPSVMSIRKVREELKKAGAQVKIIVGGAPFRFDPLLWQEVGADAMAKTASEGISIIKRFIEELQ